MDREKHADGRAEALGARGHEGRARLSDALALSGLLEKLREAGVGSGNRRGVLVLEAAAEELGDSERGAGFAEGSAGCEISATRAGNEGELRSSEWRAGEW